MILVDGVMKFFLNLVKIIKMVCYVDTCSEEQYMFNLCQFHFPSSLPRIHLIDFISQLLKNQQKKYKIHYLTIQGQDQEQSIFNQDELDLYDDKDIIIEDGITIIRNVGIIIPYYRKQLLHKLELPETATIQEIESQVRKLSIKYHPDKIHRISSSTDDKTDKFHEIQLIKDTLTKNDDLGHHRQVIYYQQKTPNNQIIFELYELINNIIPSILDYLQDGMRFIKINTDNKFVVPIEFTLLKKEEGGDVWIFPDPELDEYRSFFNNYGAGIGLDTLFKTNDNFLKMLLIEIITAYEEYFFDVKDIYYSIEYYRMQDRQRNRPYIYIVPSSLGKNTHLKHLFLGTDLNMSSIDLKHYINDLYDIRSQLMIRKKNFNIF